jgi:hypothetical protein
LIVSRSNCNVHERLREATVARCYPLAEGVEVLPLHELGAAIGAPT